MNPIDSNIFKNVLRTKSRYILFLITLQRESVLTIQRPPGAPQWPIQQCHLNESST
jgi:hypothetical protein